MTYIRLEDGFFRNPKARRLGKDGRALYLAGLCHCSRELTDGYIDETMVKLLLEEAEVKQPALRVLVELGMWEPNGHGYVVHDYVAHQRTKAKVEKARADWRRRQRKLREGHDEDPPDVTP